MRWPTVNNNIQQIRYVLDDGGSPDQVAREVATLTGSLSQLEREAISGSGRRTVTQEMTEEILYLVGTTVEYEGLTQAVSEPCDSIEPLVEGIRQGHQMLEADAIRLQCLRHQQRAVPGNQLELQDEFNHTVKRYLSAAGRLELKLREYRFLDNETFLNVFRALRNGRSVRPSDLDVNLEERVTDRYKAINGPRSARQREPELELDLDRPRTSGPPATGPFRTPRDAPLVEPLTPWEFDAFAKLRIATRPGGGGKLGPKECERWCRLWTTIAAALRVWTAHRINIQGWDSVEPMELVQAAVSVRDLVLTIVAQCAGKAPAQPLCELAKSTYQMMVAVEQMLGRMPGLSDDVGEGHDPITVLGTARREFQTGAQRVSRGVIPTLVDPRSLEPSRDAARGKAAVAAGTRSNRRRRMMVLLGSLALVAGIFCWDTTLRASLSVDYFSQAEARALSSVLESLYVADSGQGKTMAGVVSLRWHDTPTDRRAEVVQRLITKHRGQGVNEVLLRDTQGRIVARWFKGKLRMMP